MDTARSLGVCSVHAGIGSPRSRSAAHSAASVEAIFRPSSLSPCASIHERKCVRAYGNSTSYTNDTGVVVPSMSSRIASVSVPS